MKNIEDINKAAIQKLTANKKITEFSPGDTIKVGVKIVEGKRERIQYFEGVCIAKKNRDLNSSFTVRKISNGEGVERVFPVYSPLISKLEVVRRGDVRRAKLYYLRGRSGKKARIAEKRMDNKTDNVSKNTKKEASAEIEKNKDNNIYSVAGGGDTVALLNKLSAVQNFDFVSTAGGAFLEYLEGKDLPGIKALN